MGAEQLYLILVILLFLFAVSALIVGVSNDAVNFLVPAIGSKVAPNWVILLTASLGVVVGAVFSNGMMEVARKGIFHPQMFYFSEIILMFLAVMFTDIILLDFFNTYGLPTSTTVSLVFSLLGAAVAMALIKLLDKHAGGTLNDYINSGRALIIISGILLSIVVAFLTGAFVQYVARIIFTFEYEKNYKFFGSLWGGLAFTAIGFFMFLKGFKNSAFAGEPWVQWALTHKGYLMLIIFVGSTVIFEILKSVFKVNILRIVVLAGTFALAMAFAGNDLVNFIGVPLAGYSSYIYWHGTGVAPNHYLMGQLAGKVQVPSYFLLIAGLIMVYVLWTSKKARTVIETSVNLSRQAAGYERFGSSPISRSLVRMWIKGVQLVNKIMPNFVNRWVAKRFAMPDNVKTPADVAAFDLIRASVNLVVASALIALATSYKLPLSTTYVTFMVAMGSSLADRAWGRESAVYRVTGVLSVVGGWFVTAMIAFTVAALIVTFLFYGKMIGLIIMIGFTIYVLYYSATVHRRRKQKEEEMKRLYQLQHEITTENVFDQVKATILREIKKVVDILQLTKDGFISSDRRKLKDAIHIADSLKDNSKQIKKEIYRVIRVLPPELVAAAQFYVQEVDHLREIANAGVYLARRIFEHIDNNHEIFNEVQMADFKKVWSIVYEFVTKVIKIIEEDKFEEIDQMRHKKNEILAIFENIKTIEIQRIQHEEVDTINSNLFLNILAEYKNLVLFFNRLLKAHKRFYTYKVVMKQTLMTPA